MLQINKPPHVAAVERAAPDRNTVTELYGSLASFVRRQYPIMAFVWLTVAVFGVVYLFTTPPHYTAHAGLLIDSRKMQLFSQQSVLGDISVDSATVESQVEVLKYEDIALAVIKKLHLDDDPEFTSSSELIGGLFGVMRSLFTSSAPASQPDKTLGVVSAFEANLRVKRVNLTYVIDISFRSLNPDRAARIANAVANAYIADQLDAKYQANRLASRWLQDRMGELRDQASKAERAALDYKKNNNIVDTGGRLMGEQQLVELNSQLVTAQAQTAEAEARLQRIHAIISNGAPEGTVPGVLEQADPSVADTLHDEVIVKLRNQYLEDATREADLIRRVGPSHVAVANLRSQMLEIRKSIFDELDRIAETYKSDYQIATAREASIQKALTNSVTHSQSTDQAQITLHGLESSAQTYRALYDNFLQRYMEAMQQESFPIAEARVISKATPPLTRSQPNTMLVVAMTSTAGLLFAFGAGLLREISDRAFRSGKQVEDHLRADCMAVLPLVKDAQKPSVDCARMVAPGARLKPRLTSGARILENDQSMLWYVVNQPFSRFTEAVRAIKVAADTFELNNSNKVIGVTSSAPNEGKSTVAASLAQLIAHGGSSVVLVDADMRNPLLSQQLAPRAKAGLIEVICADVALNEVLWTDSMQKLAFLPTILKRRVAHTSELLGSAASKMLIDALSEHYDYVIVDLPPLAPIVDVRATTNFINSYAYVIEWGRTKIDVVEHSLGGARGIYDNLLGVVLNKANFDVLNRFDGYRGNYYYRRYYARYGHID